MAGVVRAAGWLGLVAWASLWSGCGRQADEPKHRTIEGYAESLDPATNEVAMRWYNPRTQREEVVRGVVNDETEVLINGRSARVEDIKIGSRVTVTVRIEREGGQPHYIAKRIEVLDEDMLPSVGTTTSTKPAETGTTQPTE
jgi:hypothetical protein